MSFLEDDIRNELISINAIISTQFPSGVDELGALIKKSIPTLDWHIVRLTHMLAYWKNKNDNTRSISAKHHIVTF